MAITEHYSQDLPIIGAPQRPAPDSLAQLAALHEEAEETARLANLLGGSMAAIIALAVAAGAMLAISGLARPAQNSIWAVLVLLAIGAMLHARHRANEAPFARAPLQSFALDMHAILSYAGFAWGAGAFLILPRDCSMLLGWSFAILPAAAIAFTLKERTCLFTFMIPVAGFCALAALTRPLPGGALQAGLTLIGLAAVAGICLLLLERKKPDLPVFLPAS